MTHCRKVKAFDFAIPFILREAEEWLEHRALDVGELQPFSAMSLFQLKALLDKSDASPPRLCKAARCSAITAPTAR